MCTVRKYKAFLKAEGVDNVIVVSSLVLHNHEEQEGALINMQILL